MPRTILNRARGQVGNTLAPRSRRSGSGQVNSLWQGGSSVEVGWMVLAGGGGGSSTGYSGGGGGGGLRSSVYATGRGGSLEAHLTLNVGDSVTVTVGGGGGDTGNGNNSVFHTITSLGGAGGRNGVQSLGTNGCGSGGSNNFPYPYDGSYGSTGQGYDGGRGFLDGGVGPSSYSGGGGGGTGANGGNAGTSGSYAGGNGGSGTNNDITGTVTTYGGGGGGGRYYSQPGGAGGAGGGGAGGNPDGIAGTAGLGGGGGSPTHGGVHGAGGSGRVVIRWKGTDTLSSVAAGLTYTTTTITVGSDTYRVYNFTAGTGTIVF